MDRCVDHGPVRIDDIRRRNGKLPRLIAVEAREVDLESLCVEVPQLIAELKRQAIVACHAEAEIKENRILDAVLLDPLLRIRFELR
jgi:hypothetical protein